MSDWIFFPDAELTVPAAVEDWTFSAASVDKWTLTQTTGGYGRGADGRWLLFPPGQPRTYFHPITLQDHGVLVEPESYQTVYRPRSPTLALTDLARTEQPTEPCPFGFGAFKLAASTVNTTHTFQLVSGVNVAEPIPDNISVTGQWIIKPAGISRLRMFCLQRNGLTAAADFILSGEGGTQDITGCTVSIERDTDGFYRLGMTVAVGAGATTVRFSGQLAQSDGTRNFAGNGTDGILIAYFGIERGDVMTSPSSADGVSSTIRNADDMSSVTTWMSTGPKSIGIEFTPLTNLDQTIFEAGTADRLSLRIEGGMLRYTANTNGQSVAFLSGPAAPPGSSTTVVVTAGFNEFLLGHNGAILGVDKQGSAPVNITSMRVGGLLNGTGARPLAVKRLKFWNVALSEPATIETSKDLSVGGGGGGEVELPVISVQPSITVPVGQATISILVTLSKQNVASSVNFNTTNGTALAGRDFVDSFGTISFSSGELAREIVINLGARATEDRAFSLELSNPLNATLGNRTCQIILSRDIPAPIETSLDSLFGEGLGDNWSLIRPSPAPFRGPDGIWATVGNDLPAVHWLSPEDQEEGGSGLSGVLIDAAGHDQCLFDSVIPETYLGATSTVDIVTQTQTGTRSVLVTESETTEAHGVAMDFTTANSVPPTGDFTFWMLVEPTGRTRWQLSTKGVDNIWYDAEFDLTGSGTVLNVTAGGWASVERDLFFPGYYRIALGRSQLASAGVNAAFYLAAIDTNGNTSVLGSASNTIRISHMQLESRIGAGVPLVVSGATAKTVRAPDDLRAAGTWYKRNTFTIGVLATRLSDEPPIQRIIHMRDVAPHLDDYGFFTTTGNIVRASNTTGGSFNGNMDGVATVKGTPFTVLLTSNPTSRFALFQSGVKRGEILLAGRAAPRPTETIRIGSRLDGSNLQQAAILLQRVRYWDTAMDDADGVFYSNNIAGEKPPPDTGQPTGPVVSIPATLRVKEGDSLPVTISLAGDTGTACQVTYTVKTGTATAGTDYTAVGPATITLGGATSGGGGTPATHSNPYVAEILNIFNNATGFTTLWVDDGGSDNNSGTQASPYATIKKAIAVAQTAINATTAAKPYKINVKAGTYANPGGVKGKRASPIIIESIDGQYQAKIQGVNSAAAWEMFGFAFVKIQGFDLVAANTGTSDHGGCKFHGNVDSPSSHLWFHKNKIRGQGKDAFKLFAGSKRFLVTGNVIEGTWGDPGENMDFVQAEEGVVAYNTIGGTTNGSNSITTKAGSRRIDIVGNLVQNTGGGIRLGGQGASRLERYFPDYWKGWSEGYPNGFEGYLLNAYDNIVQSTGGNNMSFIGAIKCTARNNFIRAGCGMSDTSQPNQFNHVSRDNTVENNFFGGNATVTYGSVGASGHTVRNNVGNSTAAASGIKAGANDTYLNAYLGDTSGGGTGEPSVPNPTSHTFNIQTTADTTADSNETFTIELSNPVNCSLGNARCVVTIFEPPTVFVPATATATEGQTFSMDITKTGEGACTVSWETKAVTATLNVDYTGVPPTPISFSATETTKTIQVTVASDATSDPGEKFNIQLSNPVGCTIGRTICEVTINESTSTEPPPTSGIYTRAKGFASQSSEFGIGKQVYRVTSLKDDGSAGTLRAAPNSRHVVFEVGGVIEMSGDWTRTWTDMTISGETAPYPGITIRGKDNGGTIVPGTSKRVSWSHINFERCHDNRIVTNTDSDAVRLAPGPDQICEDMEFRHCSFFWGNDEIVALWSTKKSGAADNTRGINRRISFIDCMFCEPMYKPETLGYNPHYEGGKVETGHNYAMILGVRSYEIDIQNCMFTDSGMRCPFIDADTSVVLANNIALNCNKGAHISMNNYDNTVKKFLVTCVGYLCISGPDTTASDFAGMRIHSNVVKTLPTGSKLWVDGLYSMKGPGSKITPLTTVKSIQAVHLDSLQDVTKDPKPIDIPDQPVSKKTADEIYTRAKDNIGPRPKERAIPSVARKIRHLTDKTGAFVNHQTQSGVDGPTKFSGTYNRKLDGTTKFSDGVTIADYPTVSATATAQQKANVRAWLEEFLKRLQHD